MQSTELRSLQAPIKARYREDPESALVTMTARGTLDLDRVACRVETRDHRVDAGLHPAAGGDGSLLCSGDMLLEALVACAGVTMSSVATALSLPIERGEVIAEGDLDFRGTLAVDRETPVGFKEIRLRFELVTSAGDEQIAKLVALTERYCVIFQTINSRPNLVVSYSATGASGD